MKKRVNIRKAKWKPEDAKYWVQLELVGWLLGGLIGWLTSLGLRIGSDLGLAALGLGVAK